MKNIAIFASGSGTNAQKLMEYFSNSKTAKVKIILSNKADAFVLERATKFSVTTIVFDRDDLYIKGKVLKILIDNNIEIIVLAGFLWLVPVEILRHYPDRIVNIHPALLPDYGGKGMYGSRVHKAVLENKEKESGISIHYVNEKYDEGSIIFQARCEVKPDDTPESLAGRIHKMEHKYYPVIVEKLIMEAQNDSRS
ncbi:MAG TPA: phosphoribosylglycinamide formyltransferase [Bacteroidales bacterium]|nr:phosphoribosylglycinamide formyltransferase [Bacteroidales bacterium]